MDTRNTAEVSDPPGLEDLETAQLLALVRQGSRAAYATLYDRYAYPAHRLARHLGMRDEADDVVSESFARILDLLQRGKGPGSNFRSYLFTTVRHEAGHRAKARQKVVPTDDETQIDAPVPFGGNQLDTFERTTVRAAYESLPPRWQSVLWQLDVEGHRPQDLAEALDVSANSVSALVYRARAGLRQAYLQQHVAAPGPHGTQACTDARSQLPALVQGSLRAREVEKTHAHLAHCRECMAAYTDLQATGVEIGLVAPAASHRTVPDRS